MPFIAAIQGIDLPSSGESFADAFRVFHGRGGCFPGSEHLTLDWYPPVLLLTSFREVSNTTLKMYKEELSSWWENTSQVEPLNLVYQCRSSTPTTTQLISGSVPEAHVVTENGNKFLVHLLRGQNHGLFLDMSSGRQWVKEHSRDKNVLNLFAYTCAFSVASLSGGASSVVNVDMSKGALKIGQRNHELNGLVEAGGVRFLGHNIFKTWGKLKKLGPYQLIIIDPPSYQKGSFVAKNDYIKLVRRLPSLLLPGGSVLLCLNAPELGVEFLRSQVSSAAPELLFSKRLENPSTFPALDPERALKVLLYQLPENGPRVNN